MKKALMLIDFQNDFVDGSLGTKEAQNIIPLVAQKVKSYLDKGVFIYFTFDTHYDDYLSTLEGKKLPIPHCIKNTHGHKLHNDIATLLTDYEENKDYAFIEKNHFSCLALIEKVNLDELEIIGICTDICVVSNALLLKAHFPEMSISVDSACCAGVTVEKHLAALEVLKSCHITVN